MQNDCHMVAVKVKYATGAQILCRFLMVVTVCDILFYYN